MTINEWSAAVYALAVSKGWWVANDAPPSTQDILAKIALIHSELSEALEVVRDNDFNPAHTWEVGRCTRPGDPPPKPEGFGIELADAVIRIFDLAEACGVDLERCIAVKHNYNKSRPYRHGKRA